MLYHMLRSCQTHIKQSHRYKTMQSVNNTIREHFCHTTASNTSPQHIIQLSLLEQLALYATE